MARLLKFCEVKEMVGSSYRVTKFVRDGKLPKPLPRSSKQEKRVWLAEDVEQAFASLREQQLARQRSATVTLRPGTARRVRESGLARG